MSIQKFGVFISAFLLFAGVLFAAESVEKPEQTFARENHDLLVAMINGNQFREAIWKKLQKPEGEDGAIFGDAQNYLMRHEVVLSGAMKSLTESKFGKLANLAIEQLIQSCGLSSDWKKMASARWTLVLTIGQFNQQPVNITCKIDETMAKAFAGLKPGAPVAVCGKIADSWLVLDEVSLVDVRSVAATDFKMAQQVLPAVLPQLRWESFSLPQAYSTLNDDARAELARMAQLCVLAYPARELPKGVRALTREEWKTISDGQLADELYSEDGYFVAGDGLRARLMKWRDVIVIALSGCDVSRSESGAAFKDFTTAVQHVWKGAVDEQYRLSQVLCRGVLNMHQGPVWVIGHSLGGSLVTYASVLLGGDPRVRFATFNGLGMSAKYLPKGEAAEGLGRIGPTIVNVYSDRDPVYTGHRLLRWTGFEPPRHLGLSYYLAYREPAPQAATPKAAEKKIKWDEVESLADLKNVLKQVIDDTDLTSWSKETTASVRYYHNMDSLAKEIEKVSPPVTFATSGTDILLWICVGVLALALLVLMSVLVARKCRKM